MFLVCRGCVRDAAVKAHKPITTALYAAVGMFRERD
jgi:hypothetical protein